MRQAITLTKEKRKLKSGETEYWTLRWYDQQGKFRSKSLGRTDKLSERQARKLKRQKENDFDANPGRRSVKKIPTLKEHTNQYIKHRKHELAPGTVILHQETIMYLLGYFGETRNIETITKANARAFKTALLNGDLKDASEKGRDMKATTVDKHLRNSRVIFRYAVDDDYIRVNPFEKLPKTVKVCTGWHYVSKGEFQKMADNATLRFRVLLALCRLAGLRRGEALNLEWPDIDFEHNRIQIVGKDHWQPKDKEKRIIPICPELQAILLEAYEDTPEGQRNVLPSFCEDNIDRDIKRLAGRSGVVEYGKPLHTLRKSCLTDWAARFPMHCVKEWAGHANIATTQQFYLQVSESDYDRAAGVSFWTEKVVTENVTENEKNADSEQNESENGVVNPAKQST